MKVWGEMVKKFELQKQIKLLGWPAYDPEFTTALLDHRYKQSTYYGVTAVCKIVKKRKLNRFNNLCQMYGLGGYDFYRYLQLRDYFCKKVKGCNPAEDPPAIIHIFMDAYNSGNIKGLISKLYHSITVWHQ